MGLRAISLIFVVLFSLFASGCNKTDASIVLGKLFGFKLVDERVAIDSGQIHSAQLTAKHTGALWTYIKVNNSTPVRVALLAEHDYQKLRSVNDVTRTSLLQGASEKFIQGTVEAGKKYYLVVQGQVKSISPADVTIQSYFFGEK